MNKRTMFYFDIIIAQMIGLITPFLVNFSDTLQVFSSFYKEDHAATTSSQIVW